MSDLISRTEVLALPRNTTRNFFGEIVGESINVKLIEQLPFVQLDVIRCKDCKFYTPMNRETKTGICNLTLYQNFGDDWYCAGAERRTDG